MLACCPHGIQHLTKIEVGALIAVVSRSEVACFDFVEHWRFLSDSLSVVSLLSLLDCADEFDGARVLKSPIAF